MLATTEICEILLQSIKIIFLLETSLKLVCSLK